MLGLIHYNPHLKHQRDHAQAFEACGFKATTDPLAEADVHVVSGPHYAMRHWLDHPRVLVVDRAWWGDPEAVSLGWLNADGSRRFAVPDFDRWHPEPQPWKTREQSALVLADYGQDVDAIVSRAKSRFHCVRVRRHPAEERPEVSLPSSLALSDVAIGTSGSALFDAVVAGVPSICLDPRNEIAPVCAPSLEDELVRPDRGPWLRCMAWKQFWLEEIANGFAWAALEGLQDERGLPTAHA